MKLTCFKILSALSLLFLISQSAASQNVQRVEKKLYKAFNKEKYDQVEKKATKYRKKYPKLDVSNYYLSRLEIVEFNKISIPNKSKWSHLNKASNYARKLSPDYAFWRDSIKNYYILYITSYNDEGYKSAHLKKVIKTYTSQYNDTLLIYHNYFAQASQNSPSDILELPLTDSLRTHLISFAAKYVGTPYKYAGNSPDVGFDCSGFVKYVYKSINVELPHNSHLMSELEGTVIPLEEAEPGDLIFFGSRNGKKWRTQHAGIIYEYTEEEPRVIHCVSRGVSIDGNNTSWDSYWKDRILFVKRLPQLD
jgi:cell wall-associated NlpC family hydrolase